MTRFYNASMSHFDQQTRTRMRMLADALYDDDTDKIVDALQETKRFAPNLASANDLISHLVVLASWARCRHVYDIEPTVAQELLMQSAADAIPTQAVMRMPYPCMYIRLPVTSFAYDRDGHMIPDILDGFMAHHTYTWNNEGKLMDMLGLTGVFISPKTGQLTGISHSCGLAYDTISEAMSCLTLYSLDDDSEVDEATAIEIKAHLAKTLSQMINALLYVNYQSTDQEITYRPPSGGRGQKIGPNTNLETRHLVGVRMGAALREAQVRYEKSKDAVSHTGRSVTPHIRRAHWHHYWTGPLKGFLGHEGQTLEVRWVAPVFVCGDGSEIEVVHKA